MFFLILFGKTDSLHPHFSFVFIAVILLVALCFVIGDACSLRNYQKFSFGFLYRLLYSIAHILS